MLALSSVYLWLFFISVVSASGGGEFVCKDMSLRACVMYIQSRINEHITELIVCDDDDDSDSVCATDNQVCLETYNISDPIMWINEARSFGFQPSLEYTEYCNNGRREIHILPHTITHANPYKSILARLFFPTPIDFQLREFIHPSSYALVFLCANACFAALVFYFFATNKFG
jgi:hypothetical protein